MRNTSTLRLTPFVLLGLSFILNSSNAEAKTQPDTQIANRISAEISNVITVAGTPTDALFEAGPESSAKAAGSSLSLGYTSNNFRGFTLGGAIQAGVDWGIHDEATGPTIVGGEDEIRITLSGINLQNLFIDYDFSDLGTNSSIRIGRQGIRSPLIMHSSFFTISDAFEGIVLTNSDIPKSKLQLMAFNRWFKRYDEDNPNTNIVLKHVRFDEPVLSAYIASAPSKYLKLEAQWLSNSNQEPLGDPPTLIQSFGGYKVYFLGATYNIPNSIFTVGAEYKKSNYKAQDNTYYFGIKSILKMPAYSIEVAYTKNGDNANSAGTLGHPLWVRTYAKTITNAELMAGVSTLDATFSYDFGMKNLITNYHISLIRQSEIGQQTSNANFDDAMQISFDVKYRFKSIAGLSTRLELAYTEFNDVLPDNDFLFSRLFLNYKFK